MDLVKTLFFVLLLTAAVLAGPGTASTFTYQGQLTNGGQPVNAVCEANFSLWDNVAFGNQVGATIGPVSITAAQGVFTTCLDFGASVFNSQPRWLEVEVKCPPDVSFTTLTPRQPLTSAPFASYAFSGSKLVPPSGAPVLLQADMNNRLQLSTSAIDANSHVYFNFGDPIAPFWNINFGHNLQPDCCGGVSSGVEVMSLRIVDLQTSTPEGRVGIGTDEPASALDVIGEVRAQVFTTVSDSRLKHNIEAIADPVAKVLSLRGVNYDWREESAEAFKLGSERQVGLIAQEVQAVLPEAVVHDDVRDVLAVNYDGIIPLLVEAVKAMHGDLELSRNAQQVQIKQLDDAVKALSARDRTIAELAKRLDRLEAQARKFE